MELLVIHADENPGSPEPGHKVAKAVADRLTHFPIKVFRSGASQHSERLRFELTP